MIEKEFLGELNIFISECVVTVSDSLSQCLVGLALAREEREENRNLNIIVKQWVVPQLHAEMTYRTIIS